jgi:hypothetical protein
VISAISGCFILQLIKKAVFILQLTASSLVVASSKPNKLKSLLNLGNPKIGGNSTH